jgi:vacuolar-type H+-ATPase subunit I/STV1
LQDFIKEIPEIPHVLGSIFLIISILFYFIELLKSEKILVFHRLLLFWISVGLILFYAGTIPFMLKWNGYMLIPGVHDLFLIVYILAITMYLIFSFGFIWSKKE